MTDYALSVNGKVKGIQGKVVTFPSLDEARKFAADISLKNHITVGIERIAWDIHYGRKFGIKSITNVGEVKDSVFFDKKGKMKIINADGSI